MSFNIIGAGYKFPQPRDIKINMMPFVQGDPESLPNGLESYWDFVQEYYLDYGKKGFLTIDEGFVNAGSTQRGYGSDKRTLHTEACKSLKWGSPPAWGSKSVMGWGAWASNEDVMLSPELKVLIGNSIDDTCALWDAEEEPTLDGDLGHLADRYKRDQAHLMAAGEIAEIGILTPHECIKQKRSGVRQFVRIVGEQVFGKASYFTENCKVKHNPQLTNPAD